MSWSAPASYSPSYFCSVVFVYYLHVFSVHKTIASPSHSVVTHFLKGRLLYVRCTSRPTGGSLFTCYGEHTGTLHTGISQWRAPLRQAQLRTFSNLAVHHGKGEQCSTETIRTTIRSRCPPRKHFAIPVAVNTHTHTKNYIEGEPQLLYCLHFSFPWWRCAARQLVARAGVCAHKSFFTC